MTASIHALPATTTMTPEQALQSALALNPADVLVLGFRLRDDLTARGAVQA